MSSNNPGVNPDAGLSDQTLEGLDQADVEAKHAKQQEWSQDGIRAGMSQQYYTSGETGGGAPTNSGGKGYYEFDPEQIPGLIADWEDEVHDIQTKDLPRFDRIRSMQPPSQDPPSLVHARAVVRSGQIGYERAQARLEYAQGWVNKLKAAKAEYEQQEQNTVDDMKRHQADT